MKRSHLLIGVAMVAVLALFFVLRGSGGDDKSGDRSAAPTADKTAPTGSQRVTLERQAGGQQMTALIDDDPEGTLRMEGQVINATDDPVAGATVTLGSNPPRTTVTAEDGSFHFDKLVGRPYQLVARADAGVAGPVTARLTGESDPVILRLQPGSSVEVKVLSATDRSPIAGATVELRDLGVQTEQTGADGVAKMTNVVPGGYRLAAYAPGFAKSHTWVRLPPGNVSAVTTMTLRRGAAVTGIVSSPDGAPVKDARVTYAGASDWSQQADPRYDAAITDDEGRFRFDALPPGSFRFLARHPGYAPGRSEIVTLDGSSEKSGVNVRLESGATLTGIVSDTEGAPVASASVRVGVRIAGMNWSRPRQAYTNEAGAYEITGLPQRPSQVVAVHETASSETIEVDLTGRDQESVDITLDRDGTIAGTVVDSAGEPIEGASVSAWPDFGRGRGGRRSFRQDMRLRGGNSELTDAGGRFVIRGLDDGDYQVRATPPGSAGGGFRRMISREPVDAKTGDTDVKIVLPADGGVKGVVTFADGKAPSIFTVGFGFRGGTPFSSDDGKFELKDLPPRTYTINITGPGFDPRRIADVEVKEGEVADLGKITVNKGRSVAGRVTLNGSPVAGATVVAGRRMFGSGSSTNSRFGPFGGSSKEAQTDDNGNFVLNGVGPSDLMIIAEHEEKGRSQTLAIRGTRDSVTGLEIELAPFGALEGKVTEAGGKPAEGVRVSVQSQTAPSAVFGVATGPDGRFRFDKLAPDTYKISAIPGGGGPMGGMAFLSKVVTVVSGQTVSVDLGLDLGTVSLLVKPTPTNADKLNFAFINYVEGEVQAETARQLELAIAQITSRSGFSMSIRGNAATIRDLKPGQYTVCATPTPVEVSGMGDTMAYMEREGDNLRVFCQPVTVAAEPAEQSVDLPIEVPSFIPATGDNG